MRHIEVNLLIVLAGFAVLPWHVTNTHTPIYDAAAMSATSIEIAHRLQDDFMSGIAALYTLRGWRPIIFPAFAAPFFALPGEQPRTGIALTQYFAVLMIALYTFALARQYLSPRRALVAASFLSTLPFIVVFSGVFYAEVAWLAATAGWLYHTVASNGFQHLRHSLLSGGFIALMICVRPAESLLVVPAGCLVFLISANIIHRDRQISAWRDFLWSCLAALLLSTAWWAPFVHKLYNWAHASSSADSIVVASRLPPGLGFFSIAFRAALHCAPLQLTFLALSAAILFVLSRRKPSESGAHAALPYQLIIAGLATVLPVVTAFMITGTSAYRRIFASYFILHCGLTIYFLHPAFVLPRARAAVLASFAVLQAGLAAANGFGLLAPRSVERQIYPVNSPATHVDPNRIFLTEMEKVVPAGNNIAAYTQCYRDREYGCTRRNISWFEPEALTALALARRSGIRFHWVAQLDVERSASLAQQLRRRKFSYLVLDMFDKGDKQSSPAGYSKTTAELIRLMNTQGTIPGFIPLKKYRWSERDIFLFQIDPDARGTSIVDLPYTEIIAGPPPIAAEATTRADTPTAASPHHAPAAAELFGNPPRL